MTAIIETGRAGATTQTIAVGTLCTALADGGELALLDVRDNFAHDGGIESKNRVVGKSFRRYTTTVG
jgi:hypothetical protein